MSQYLFFNVSRDITYLFYKLVLKVFHWIFSQGLLGNNKHGFTASSLLLLPWAGLPTPYTHIFPLSFSVSWIQHWVSEMIWKSSMWLSLKYSTPDIQSLLPAVVLEWDTMWIVRGLLFACMWEQHNIVCNWAELWQKSSFRTLSYCNYLKPKKLQWFAHVTLCHI